MVYGALEPYLKEQRNLMAYYRRGEKTLLVMGNFQREEQEVALPAACKRVLLNNYPDADIQDLTIRMQGYQVVILEM